MESRHVDAFTRRVVKANEHIGFSRHLYSATVFERDRHREVQLLHTHPLQR